MLQVARENGISDSAYHGRVRRGWDKQRAATEEMQRQSKNYHGDYAVYRKGELVIIGSLQECAEHLGVKESTIRWMSTPSAQRRSNNAKNPEMAMYVDKLDEEGDWDE